MRTKQSMYSLYSLETLSSPASLLRHVDHCALQHSQESLLHALPAHVAGDADVLTLLGDLVNL